MDWSSGYIVDTPYKSAFFSHTAPSYLRFVALLAGHAVLEGSPRGLELGCGTGYGTAVLAASNPDQRWTGVDFNPAHIAVARRLQQAAGLDNLDFIEASFDDLLRDEGRDLPLYDYVCLHGVYSWISVENARKVREILARRLANGGLVYVSYNCLPGWSELAPSRRLMLEHARRIAGDSARKARAAADFVVKLQEQGARALLGPLITQHVKSFAGHDGRYLAHEYLNADWRLPYHADVAAEMAEVRLAYLASADIIDAVVALSIPHAMIDMITSEPDPVMAETLRDFAINRRFRRDLYHRGAYPLLKMEKWQAVRKAPITLVVDPAEIKLEALTPLGKIALKEELYRPVIAALQEGPVSLGELAREDEPMGRVAEIATVLIHAGYAHPVARELDQRARETARRFNTAVARRVATGDQQLTWLAAPAIGTGIKAGFVECLAYLALVAGEREPTAGALVDGVTRQLRRMRVQLVKDGKNIEDPAEERRDVAASMDALLNRKLPVWRRLGVI